MSINQVNLYLTDINLKVIILISKCYDAIIFEDTNVITAKMARMKNLVIILNNIYPPYFPLIPKNVYIKQNNKDIIINIKDKSFIMVTPPKCKIKRITYVRIINPHIEKYQFKDTIISFF